MAQYSGFFNGELNPDGTFDRVYLAASFARYFSSFIGNGVFPFPSGMPSDELAVAGNGTNATVAAGRAFINGYYFESTEDEVLSVPIGGSVVIRLDVTNRVISLAIGNSITPVRNDSIYELIIALNQNGTIIDTRSDVELCGFVRTVLSENSGGSGLADVSSSTLQVERNSSGIAINLTQSQLQNISKAATALQTETDPTVAAKIVGKIDKTLFTDSTVNPNGFVLLWIQPNFSADVVNVDYGAVQPVTGQFTAGNVALPFSDTSKAGLMSKEQAAALDNAVQDISNLVSGSGFEEQWFDTRAELIAADVSAIVQGTPAIIWEDEGESGATTKWKYSPSDNSGREKVNGFVFGGIAQEVPYSVANTNKLGLVLSSTIPGKGNIEPNGVISVEGWDALVARISALESALQQQNAFNTTHDHSGGSMGALTPKDFIVYANDSQALADTSGNQALSPIQ